MITTIIPLLLLAFFSTELLLHFWLLVLRKRFDLILTAKDRYPEYEQKALQKFLAGSYDPELGWVRKPNTTKTEHFLGEEKSYYINAQGSRINPGHEKQPTTIITVGDSYAFCRETNDDETWQHFLANIRKHNISNYGVGNYGMDQALLRFKRALQEGAGKKAKYAIMAVVPETIQRNLACWKHYSEYGNTFAFKPRFIIKNNKLILIKNFANKPEHFYNLKTILPKLNRYDHFHKDFEQNVLTFPYTINIIRKRKLKQLLSFSAAQIFELLHINWRTLPFIPTQKIKEDIGSNVALKKALYHNEDTRTLSLAILKAFAKEAKQHKLKPVFMLMPQEDDLRDLMRTKKAYYQQFLDEASSFITVVDLVTPLLKLKKPLNIFFQKRYSNNFVVINGHYNAYGNKLIAKELNKTLKQL